MDIKPDFDRIRKAIKHEEPDRVPLIEVLVELPVQSRFLGRKVTDDDIESQIEFWAKAGYDYVPVVVGMMTPGKVTSDSAISRALKERLAGGSPGDEAWNLEYNSFIHDRSDFERFPWEVLEPDFNRLHKTADLLPEGMKIIVINGKIFTLTWMLMGFENFGECLLLDEKLVSDVFEKVASVQSRAVEKVLEHPKVAAVWAVDDIAFSTGTMISLQALRDHLFPFYKKMAAMCHERGRLFFFHSDGDIRPAMEDLIDSGVDAIHPIDPSVLDIARIKHECGDRICLFGNVSTELLRSGTPQEVERTVKDLLQTVAPGGGYCLGSGNSVPEWVSLENYNVMRETVLRYGNYPITLSHEVS